MHSYEYLFNLFNLFILYTSLSTNLPTYIYIYLFIYLCTYMLFDFIYPSVLFDLKISFGKFNEAWKRGTRAPECNSNKSPAVYQSKIPGYYWRLYISRWKREEIPFSWQGRFLHVSCKGEKMYSSIIHSLNSITLLKARQRSGCKGSF